MRVFDAQMAFHGSQHVSAMAIENVRFHICHAPEAYTVVIRSADEIELQAVADPTDVTVLQRCLLYTSPSPRD